MIIVVDVNPLLAALIRDSTTRDIIVNSGFEFCFPEPALHKIRKYKNYIIKKSGLSELEYLVILHTLLRFMRIISAEEIMQHWDEAKQVMGHIDPEDVTFIATALSQDEAVIWSDDAHFDKQDKIINLKTKDVINLLRS
ncbi:PIN domain-containing protein [Candidatus Woesearchaeota archaeon]|nr:PIN domain-containing protein [Candidatus Woesearchaeota archaeon]